jgi:hypothetical protein
MSLALICHLALALATFPSEGSGPDPAGGAGLESPVRSALKRESFPWYDREKDQVKPLLDDPSSWSSWLGKRADVFLDWLERHFGRSESSSVASSQGDAGGALVTLFFLVSGGALVFLLWRLWRLHEPRGSLEGRPAISVGEAARIAGLVPGNALEGIDPWEEALRRRAAGDLAAAVIWLFLDQLLSLKRAGLIRLTPGRTARQYVPMVEDPQLRDGLRHTLGVFEEVSYGHRLPGPVAVQQAFSQAEAFHRRLESISTGAQT